LWSHLLEGIQFAPQSPQLGQTHSKIESSADPQSSSSALLDRVQAAVIGSGSLFISSFAYMAITTTTVLFLTNWNSQTSMLLSECVLLHHRHVLIH
jgi:hypothetical protein